jgi:hypothetical protein
MRGNGARTILVENASRARERKRASMGRCEDRKPIPDHVVNAAKALYRQNPKTHRRLSLRQIASELAKHGMHILQEAVRGSGCDAHAEKCIAQSITRALGARDQTLSGKRQQIPTLTEFAMHLGVAQTRRC